MKSLQEPQNRISIGSFWWWMVMVSMVEILSLKSQCSLQEMPTRIMPASPNPLQYIFLIPKVEKSKEKSLCFSRLLHSLVTSVNLFYKNTAMFWIMYLSKMYTLKPKSLRWGLWEVIRVTWGHEDGTLKLRLVLL